MRFQSTWLKLAMVAGMLFLATAVRAQEPGLDPVEDLRLALLIDDVLNPTAGQIEFRNKNLDDKIAALKTISDLRRALSLDEWRIDLEARNATLRKIDTDKRAVVGKRLQQSLHDILTAGEPDARLAGALLLSEMGSSVQALDVKDRAGFARSMTADLKTLAVYKDVGARHEALRALGNINADPDEVVPLYRNVMDRGDAKARLVTGQAMGQMMRVVRKLRERSLINQKATNVEATSQDVIHTAALIVPVCRMGLKDADRLVRSASLEAISEAAQGLLDMILDPFPMKDLPPPGRQLTPAEVTQLLTDYEKVRAEFAEVEPYVKLLGAAAGDLIPSLGDNSPEIRLLALDALVPIAHVRYMQNRRLESAPLPSNAKGVQLIKTIDPLTALREKGGFPAVFKLLGDDDLRIRQRVLDGIEYLEADALPAIPVLESALRDAVRSIREAAVRILGELPVDNMKGTAASVGKLLLDPDPDVRRSAATTLGRLGPDARAAVPSLKEALNTGDVETVEKTCPVISRLDPKDARPLVPRLIKLLSHDDDRCLIAAARTLGRIGPEASAAIPALRKLLGHENAAVRVAASDAILGIMTTPAPKRKPL